MKKRYIRHASELVTCKGSAPKHGKEMSDIGLIKDGAVIIHDDKIVATGTTEELDRQVDLNEYEVIDAAGKTVMPGFVDSHTHFIFGGYRADEFSWRLKGDSYMSIMERGGGINATVVPTREATEEELIEAGEERLNRMLEFGVTTVEGKSGYGLTMESELRMLEVNRELNEELPLDIFSTFLGAHGWTEGMKKEVYIDLLCKEMIPRVAGEKLAVCNDIWCDEGHYTAKECETVLAAGRDYGLAPRIHTDAYSYIGGSDLAADMHMLSADHLNYTPVSVFQKLKDADVTGVLLVGTDFAVNHPKQVDPRPMLDIGMDLGLATNCCPGCWCESMIFILVLACRQHGFSAEEALRAATKGAAKAMGLKDRGSLTPGKLADLLILDTDTYEDLIYKYGRNPIETIIKKGKVAAKGGILCI